MSAIVDFFNGQPDTNGRTIKDMLEMTDAGLEATHNVIQWLFPLHEKSLHSVDTPVLTPDDIAVLRSDSTATFNILDALKRFRDFYGFLPVDEKKKASWCNDGNHNLLRITRIIRSLRLFGIEDVALAFYGEVRRLAESRNINRVTLEFWRKAAEEPLDESLTHDFLKIKSIDL